MRHLKRRFDGTRAMIAVGIATDEIRRVAVQDQGAIGDTRDTKGDIADMIRDVREVGGDLPDMTTDVPNMIDDVPDVSDYLPNITDDVSDMADHVPGHYR